MASVFIILMDTAKKRTDYRQMNFYRVSALSDVAGFVTGYAEKNNVPVNDIRLFVAPSKKVWTEMSLDFQKRIVWP